MTFLELMKKELSVCLSEEQVQEVCKRTYEDPTNKDMAGRWFDSVDDYPTIIGTLLIRIVRQHALEYLNETYPKVWFKDYFDDKIQDALVGKVSTYGQI